MQLITYFNYDNGGKEKVEDCIVELVSSDDTQVTYRKDIGIRKQEVSIPRKFIKKQLDDLLVLEY